LETTLAAHGSGAIAASLQAGARVMNIDIGGGTSKIAVCIDGRIDDLTALDVGARLICLDENGRVARIEPAGQSFADAAGIVLHEGAAPPEGGLAAIAAVMAERLCEACGVRPLSDATRKLLRLPALRESALPNLLILSGGVAAYMARPETPGFGDLGALLAKAVTDRLPEIRVASSGIRATVIGASQHSVQLSGNTIFIEPDSVLPLPNIPVIAPNLPLDIDPQDAITTALQIRDLADSPGPVALAYRWRGDATHARLDAFCMGVIQAFAPLLSRGLALVLVGDGDVGGLIGVHCRSLLPQANAVVSIDGIAVRDCDFIDIGELLQISGGVPVVVKSLVFPTSV
jgi:ethanolamine utilization protein EutA